MKNIEEEFLEIARQNGLDPFPVIFETIEQDTMNNIASYGLPTRARHWSYGRSYEHQKTYGEMGYSKIFEVILNNNPSYAFMMDTNTELQNKFIIFHCYAHSHFFKNNYLFKNTDRKMISHAAEHATRIDNYIEKYGFDKVERLMDIGFALDSHIDWHKGIFRKPYGKKKISLRHREVEEFDDVGKNKKSYIIKELINYNFPPYPEKDILWFMSNYVNLEEWEKDILDIAREESYYFYPQRLTKTINEGWASYWHAELMYQLDLPAADYLEFVRDHEKVVQPGGNPFRINPYFLGFRILKDIEKRWDNKYGKGAGKKKIFQVCREEDDISFLRNYLTADLVEELNLFTYGYVKDYTNKDNEEKFIEIKDRVREEVVESLVKPLYNGGAPKIVIKGVDPEGTLILEHISEEIGTIEQNFAKRTLEYIWELWAAPIELKTLDDDGFPIHICFDEGGPYIRKEDEEDSKEDLRKLAPSLFIP